MSHVSTLDGLLIENDPIILKRAVERLGGTFLQDQKTYRWFGGWADDSPVPRGLFETQAEYDRVVGMSYTDRTNYMNAMLGMSVHAASFPGSTYEVGFARVGDHLTAVFDWFTDSSGLLKKLQDQFPQAYAVESVIRQAELCGFAWQEEKLPDGSVEIVTTRY